MSFHKVACLLTIFFLVQISYSQQIRQDSTKSTPTPNSPNAQHSIGNVIAAANATDNDVRRIEYKNRFGVSDYESPEVNFYPGGFGSFAGDINGDGKDDLIRTYRSVSDRRTEELGDNTHKTLVFYGGNLSEEYDDLIYTDLRPIGDFNGDGFADAVGRNVDFTYDFYWGSEEGYTKGEPYEFTIRRELLGFRDFDQDGFDDILTIQTSPSDSEFFIIYGAETLDEAEEKVYATVNKFSLVVPSNLNKPIITEIAYEQTPTSNLFVNTREINSQDRSISSISNSELDFSEIALISIESSRFFAIDMDGDGMDEIFINQVTVFPFALRANLALHGNSQGYSEFNFVGNPEETSNFRFHPVGDLNNDGKHDFLVKENTGRLEIQFGTGLVNDNITIGAETLPIELDEAVFATSLPTAGFQRNQIASQGDLNGDGTDDLQIGYFKLDEFGQITILGNEEIDVEEPAQSVYLTDNFNSKARHLESANLGDWNGDGYEELVLLFEDRAEVFLGGGFKITPDYIIDAEEYTYQQMETGDFNGDGKTDLAIGMIISSGDRAAEFESSVVNFYFGSSQFSVEASKTIPGSVLNENPNDSFSQLEINTIGDINDDGFEDFTFKRSISTSFFLFYGGTELPSAPSFSFEVSSLEYDNKVTKGITGSGIRSESLGDINGDGVDDFVLADMLRPFRLLEVNRFNSGVLFVFFGEKHEIGEKEELTPDLYLAMDSPEYQSFKNFGYNTEVGDFNGDGHNDLITTSTEMLQSVAPLNGGKGVRIYFGGPDFDNIPDKEFAIPAALFGNDDLENIATYLGETITIEDVNGDGADELFLGSLAAGDKSAKTNGIIILGGANITDVVEPKLQVVAPNQSTFLSIENNSTLKRLRSTIGDFDGDGIQELVLPQNKDRNFRSVPIYTFPVQDPLRELQTISFEAISDKTTQDDPFELSATSSSGLPVTFEVVSGPATVENSTITLTNEGGEVVIRASQIGNENYNPAPFQFQRFQVELVTSIERDILEKAISVYPNPAEDYLTINLRSIDYSQYKSLQLTDRNGTEVRLIDLNGQLSSTLSIAVDKLTKGLYFVKITTNKATVIKRVLIN